MKGSLLARLSLCIGHGAQEKVCLESPGVKLVSFLVHSCLIVSPPFDLFAQIVRAFPLRHQPAPRHPLLSLPFKAHSLATLNNMPASRQDKTTPSSSRRTVKHVQPLQKGLACLTCESLAHFVSLLELKKVLTEHLVYVSGSARRVRCSGERPACAACVRHARWSGRDTTNDHGCRYRESSVTTEEEQPVEEQPEPAVELTEEQKELSAAKARIRELEQQVGESSSLSE